MNLPKVSIVMPCYNGADTIARAIRGVLRQTYRPIQLILVNDGSTDVTDKVITDLRPEIDASGVDFIYHLQQNLGLGGAINTGLKFVTGEYLAWADADDELLPESVRIRVEFLESHPEFGSVTSDAVLAEDANWDLPLGRLTHNPEENNRPDQFLPMLLGQSVFCPGCHLVRTEVFRTANGGMDIYPARHGQNWQMLLPVYYASRHAFLDQPLYKYRINADSMSSAINQMPLQKLYRRRREYIELVGQTLSRIIGMNARERKVYLRIFKKYIYTLNLDSSLENQALLDSLKWRLAIKAVSLFIPNHFYPKAENNLC